MLRNFLCHNCILTLFLFDFCWLLKSLNLVKINKTEIVIVICPACKSPILISWRVHWYSFLISAPNYCCWIAWLIVLIHILIWRAISIHLHLLLLLKNLCKLLYTELSISIDVQRRIYSALLSVLILLWNTLCPCRIADYWSLSSYLL